MSYEIINYFPIAHNIVNTDILRILVQPHCENTHVWVMLMGIHVYFLYVSIYWSDTSLAQ